MKKRILLVILSLAVIIAAFGIVELTRPIFSRPVEDDQDEVSGRPDKLLLVMLPLSGDYAKEINSYLEKQLKDPSWLPEGLIQGEPPREMEQFQLPARFYEAEELVSGSFNRLTFDLLSAPAVLNGDELEQLLAEDEDSYYYLWLPLKEVQGGGNRASFLLDTELVTAGAAAHYTVLPLNYTVNENQGYELVVSKISREEEVFNPRVGLYTGKGAWKVNVEALGNFLDYYGIPWQGFDETDIVEMNLQDHFELLWFPGGFSAEYKYYIPEPGHSKIKEFVFNGGKFIGICAGAYYAADMMVWKGKNLDYPLDLFPGRSIGPMSEYVSWGEKTVILPERSHPANEEFPLSSPEMFYFDGPYFVPFDETGDQIEVLARYRVNGEPAAVAAAQGQGKVLLLGMHPELGYNPSSGRAYTHGEEGACWDWLYAVLQWFVQN